MPILCRHSASKAAANTQASSLPAVMPVRSSIARTAECPPAAHHATQGSRYGTQRGPFLGRPSAHSSASQLPLQRRSIVTTAKPPNVADEAKQAWDATAGAATSSDGGSWAAEAQAGLSAAAPGVRRPQPTIIPNEVGTGSVDVGSMEFTATREPDQDFGSESDDASGWPQALAQPGSAHWAPQHAEEPALSPLEAVAAGHKVPLQAWLAQAGAAQPQGDPIELAALLQHVSRHATVLGSIADQVGSSAMLWVLIVSTVAPSQLRYEHAHATSGLPDGLLSATHSFELRGIIQWPLQPSVSQCIRHQALCACVTCQICMKFLRELKSCFARHECDA